MAKEFRTALIIEGNAKGGVRAVQATEKELKQLNERQTRTIAKSEQMASAFGTVKTAIAGMAAGFALQQLGQMSLQAVETTAKLGNMADATDVSAEKLQQLLFAMRQFNSQANIDDAVEALATLSDHASDAVSGTKSYIESFALIGLTVEELRGKNPVQLFKAFAEAIETSESSTRKMTAASRILGDDLAIKLMPLLALGADGFEKLAQQARASGLILSEDLVEGAQEADRAIKRVTQSISVEFKRQALSVLTDPETIEGIKTFGNAFVTAMGWAAEAVASLTNDVKTLAEDFAKMTRGAGTRLHEINTEIEQVRRKMSADGFMSRYGIFSLDGEIQIHLSDKDLKAQLQNLQSEKRGILESMGMLSIEQKLTGANSELESFQAERKRLQGIIANNSGTARAQLAKIDLQTVEARIQALKTQIDGLSTKTATDKDSDNQDEDPLKDQSSSVDKLQAEYDDLTTSLHKQIALYGETSDVAQLRYRLEQGDLAALAPKRKEHLLSQAKELANLKAQTQATEERKAAMQSLFPVLGKLRDLKERAEYVDSLGSGLGNLARKQLENQTSSLAMKGAPAMSGLDASIGGAFSEASRLERQRSEYEAWYRQRLAMLREFKSKEYGITVQAQAAIEQLNQQHHQRTLVYENQVQAARMAGYSEVFGTVGDLMAQFAGRQSGLFQTMFAAQKAFHLASVLMSSTDAIAKAWSSAPFPANLPAVATTVAETGVLQAAISSVSLAGMAHDGIDNVPREGTWLLDKGERVIDQRTNVDLTRFLATQNQGTNGGDTINFAPVIEVKAQPGMSHQEARQQGRQIGDALRQQFQAMLIDEKRPGGLLSESG